MNYQLLENGTFDYVHIGDWNGGEIRLFNTTSIQYGTQTKPPTSVCSRPCDPGYYKVIIYLVFRLLVEEFG